MINIIQSPNFTDDRLLLGIVSHEYLYHVYPPNQEIADKILKTGRWKYLEDIPSRQIDIKQILMK